jgi:isoleucyl-tRNA synthetase
MDKIEVNQFLVELTEKLIRKQTVKRWQACRWRVRQQKVRFEVCGLLFKGTVELELNDNQDAYNIYFLNRLGTELEKFIPNVDGKNLVQVLDTYIENPLDGSYFERVKQNVRKQNSKKRYVM